MRFRLLAAVAAAAIVAIAVVTLLPRHGHTASGATIGTNALPMDAGQATYRLDLDGSAAVVPTPPSSSVPDGLTSPNGRYRVADGKPGMVLVDERTGSRDVLTRSVYPGGAYWGPNGLLAFTARSGGLARLVALDPATGTRRVVASHLCGGGLVDPWSPDGRSLALSVSPPGGGCNGHGGPEPAVTDARVGGMRRLTEPRTWPVTWNSDGSAVLVAVSDEAHAPFGASRLVDPRTGQGQVVLPSLGALAPGSWSAGRRFYAALAGDPAQAAQVVVIVDGRLRRIVRSVRFGAAFAWAPRAQTLAVADDREVRVIDARTGRTTAVIPARTPRGLSVTSLQWDRDGRSVLASAAPTALFHD